MAKGPKVHSDTPVQLGKRKPKKSQNIDMIEWSSSDDMKAKKKPKTVVKGSAKAEKKVKKGNRKVSAANENQDEEEQDSSESDEEIPKGGPGDIECVRLASGSCYSI